MTISDRRKKPPRLRKATVVAFALTLLGITACTSQPNSVPADPNVSVGLSQDYATLDFQTRATPTILGYSFPGYDRLIGYTADKKELVPYLATDWTLSPADAPTAITFTLRDDAVCPDGSRITPSVVKASMDRFVNVKKVANRLPNLFGPGPYSTSIDESANTFTWTSGGANVNLAFGFAQTGIICPAGLEAEKTDPLALTKQQYGSGPYEMVKAESGVGVSWKKRDNWSWGPEGTSLDQLPETLEYRIVSDPTTLTNLITTGDLDFGAVEGANVRRFVNDSSIVSKNADNHMGSYLLYNQLPERITVDPDIRQAITTAVSGADALAASGGQGTASPTMVHPDTPCYLKDAEQYLPKEQTAEAAHAILEKTGKLGTPLNLVTSNTTGGLGDFLAGQLEKAGFAVKFDSLNFGENATRYIQNDWDVIVAQSINYDFAQGANLQLYYGPAAPAGSNTGLIGGGDPVYDAAGRESTQTKDCGPLETLQKLALEKNYMLPLYFPTTYAVGKTGWDFPPVLDRMEFEWLNVKK